MTTSMKVTSATSADYHRLIEVWEAAVRETHHFLSESDIIYFKRLLRDEFLFMVNLSTVRDTNQQVIGFSGVADCKLEMLFVDPKWQRRGVGKMLLTHAIQLLGVTHVDVNEQNRSAVQFYLDSGAEVIARADVDSMGKPFPLLHMRLAHSNHSKAAK